MAKVNVHSASRDELVEAGVRAELADEILKLRRKGKISLEALDELSGVGPATLEQLRKALDFSDKAGNGSGNGGEPARQNERSAKEAPERTAEAAREGGRTTKETTVRTAEVARSAVRGGTEATQVAVSASAQAATRVARGGLQVVQQAADAAGEMERTIAHRSAEGTAELGQALIDLMNAQTRHNLETWSALTRAVDWDRAAKAVDWDRVIQIQSEFVRASLERVVHLTQRYFEVAQAVTVATADIAKGQARKVA